VHYENRSCDILVRSDETILTALERNQISLENLGLPNSMIPSDCRRGNCLTCTGTHASVSSRLASGTAVVCDGDGLSPHMSRTIQEKGYILTCSTRVVGEGLQLNLGENHKVWKDIYQDRLEEEPTQSAKWAAMARSRRRSDERNKARWEKHMEELLQQQAEQQQQQGEGADSDSDKDGDEHKESR
jgi:ferredoxin